MLQLVTDEERTLQSQTKLKDTILSTLPKMITGRKVGFPSGSVELDFSTFGDGRMYYAFRDMEEEGNRRKFWNTFGIYDEKKNNQNIVFEACILKDSPACDVAGFLAEDVDNGVVYLMHSGGVAGGYPGVGKTNFRAYQSEKHRRLVDVMHEGKVHRDGYVIGRIDTKSIVERVWSFLLDVREFKDFMRTEEGQLWASSESSSRYVNHDPELSSHDDIENENDRDEYSVEGRGKRRRIPVGSADYVSYHGDIVDALKRHIERRLSIGHMVINTVKVDLCVSQDGIWSEVFEVKTSSGRQSIYTALGQVLTHSCNPKCENPKRWLVIPNGDNLPSDIRRSLKAYKVDVLSFTLNQSQDKLNIKFENVTL
ncbi:hypothetical protein [Thalassospira alkalitolerans]|uniref:hypothetical protein n=1 Tax=Thalassospira alkalitolerans TaxID=1293890 RepID=UPI003AA8176A